MILSLKHKIFQKKIFNLRRTSKTTFIKKNSPSENYLHILLQQPMINSMRLRLRSTHDSVQGSNFSREISKIILTIPSLVRLRNFPPTSLLHNRIPPQKRRKPCYLSITRGRKTKKKILSPKIQ